MSDFPRNLLQSPSGFPDLLPNEVIALDNMIKVIKKHYENAGFSPIETPLIERTEVLTSKSEGEINTQMYGLRLMNPDQNAPTDTKDLVLRFDHTIPLARYVVAHQREINFPFKRYVIGPVFRGERPKEGRYRQFLQADIDIIGDGSLDTLHDSEAIGIIANIMEELNIGDFTMRIGNRKVLSGLLKGIGIDELKILDAQFAIDRIEKVKREETLKSLAECGATNDDAIKLLELITKECAIDDLILELESFDFGEEFKIGIGELKDIIRGARALNIREDRFKIDLSIARGLNYYTGNVYETFLDNHKEIGSIASGGRYENLAGSFTNKELPGVGISIGVTRLIFKLIKAGLIKADKTTEASVIITTALPLKTHGEIYLRQAGILRKAGIATETYLTDRALGKELEYANKKGFKIALIAGENELEKNSVIIRNLITGEQKEVLQIDLVEAVKSILN